VRREGVRAKVMKATPREKWNGCSHELRPIMLTWVEIQIMRARP
jgi:hypothetical protein